MAVRRDDGDVKLNQLVNTTAAGAASGGMWGALVGLLFLNPLVGAALGAGVGALSGRFTESHRRQIHEGRSGSVDARPSCALFMVRRVTADKVIPAMAPFGGTVLRTNLSDEQEGGLQAALKAV